MDDVEIVAKIMARYAKRALEFQTPQAITTALLQDLEAVAAPDAWVVVHTGSGGPCYWRPSGCGYADSIFGAGLFSQETAERMTAERVCDHAVSLRAALEGTEGE